MNYHTRLRALKLTRLIIQIYNRSVPYPTFRPHLLSWMEIKVTLQIFSFREFIHLDFRCDLAVC